MHELSIAQALIEQLEEVARTNRATAVTGVTVVVGSLSGVDPDALDMAFPLAAEHGVAQGARLELQLVSARAVCKDCGARLEPDFPLFVCEACGSNNVEITGGRDLMITSVDLDLGEAPGHGSGTNENQQ